eukprot:8189950-Karenia_brevis.AAC.1
MPWPYMLWQRNPNFWSSSGYFKYRPLMHQHPLGHMQASSYASQEIGGGHVRCRHPLLANSSVSSPQRTTLNVNG